MPCLDGGKLRYLHTPKITFMLYMKEATTVYNILMPALYPEKTKV